MTAKASKRPKAKPAARAAKPPPPGAIVLMDVRDVAAALRANVRYVWSILAAGDFPPADLRVGNRPRWKTETFNRWVESKGNDGKRV